jgi:hypothetical protein
MTKIEGTDGMTLGEVALLLFGVPVVRVNGRTKPLPDGSDLFLYSLRAGNQFAVVAITKDGWMLEERKTLEAKQIEGLPV